MCIQIKAICRMVSRGTLTVIKIPCQVSDKMSTTVGNSQDRNVVQEKAKSLTNIFIFMNLGTHTSLRLLTS